MTGERIKQQSSEEQNAGRLRLARKQTQLFEEKQLAGRHHAERAQARLEQEKKPADATKGNRKPSDKGRNIGLA